MLALIDTPSLGEILMILVVALLVFGGKLPEVARTLGKSITKMKRSVENLRSDIREEVEKSTEIKGDGEEKTPPPLPPENTSARKKA